MRRGRLFSLVGISQDITERRQLTQLLADAADHERVRLGADLHDGICQELTGLSMLLDSHAKNDGVVSPMASTLRELAVIARTTATNARALAHGMLPVDLRQGGLGAALRRLAQPLARVPAVAIVVEMTAEAEQLIDQRIGEQFFRIAQEAVSNAVRHGQARGITLRVEAVGSKAVLTVTDNGIGIAAKSNAAGLGLRTMAYRARLLGGLLTTRRLPHGGTRVRCVVPTEHASRPDDTSLEATM